MGEALLNVPYNPCVVSLVRQVSAFRRAALYPRGSLPRDSRSRGFNLGLLCMTYGDPKSDATLLRGVWGRRGRCSPGCAIRCANYLCYGGPYKSARTLGFGSLALVVYGFGGDGLPTLSYGQLGKDSSAGLLNPACKVVQQGVVAVEVFCGVDPFEVLIVHVRWPSTGVLGVWEEPYKSTVLGYTVEVGDLKVEER